VERWAKGWRGREKLDSRLCLLLQEFLRLRAPMSIQLYNLKFMSCTLQYSIHVMFSSDVQNIVLFWFGFCLVFENKN